MILFMYCGLADSLVQTYAYWIIGAITNCPTTLSRFVGYYKGVQSLGAMFAWLIEYYGVLYKWQLVICFTLAVAFIPPTFVVATLVTDHGGAEGAVDYEGSDDCIAKEVDDFEEEEQGDNVVVAKNVDDLEKEKQGDVGMSA